MVIPLSTSDSSIACDRQRDRQHDSTTDSTTALYPTPGAKSFNKHIN